MLITSTQPFYIWPLADNTSNYSDAGEVLERIPTNQDMNHKYDRVFAPSNECADEDTKMHHCHFIQHLNVLEDECHFIQHLNILEEVTNIVGKRQT